MRAPLLFFFVLVLLSSNASAGFWDYAGPFSILGEKVFDGGWSVADKHGTPIENVESDAHIRAWIDIIGFENKSIINETHYVNGSAKDFAIVRRDAWHTLTSGVVVSFTSTYGISDLIGGNATNNETNTTTATQTTKLHWKYWVSTLIGGYWVHVHEGPLTVSCTVESPKKFNNSLSDYEITITSYNNSVTPYTLIYIPNRANIVKHSVHYKNDTAEWHNLTGLVQENNRGTEHVEFFDTSAFVIDENETITKRAEYFVINEAPLNWSLLNISVYTPYVEKNDAVCSVTIHHSKPSDFVAGKLLVTFLGIMGVFAVGICIATRGVKL